MLILSHGNYVQPRMTSVEHKRSNSQENVLVAVFHGTTINADRLSQKKVHKSTIKVSWKCSDLCTLFPNFLKTWKRCDLCVLHIKLSYGFSRLLQSISQLLLCFFICLNAIVHIYWNSMEKSDQQNSSKYLFLHVPQKQVMQVWNNIMLSKSVNVFSFLRKLPLIPVMNCLWTASVSHLQWKKSSANRQM